MRVARILVHLCSLTQLLLRIPPELPFFIPPMFSPIFSARKLLRKADHAPAHAKSGKAKTAKAADTKFATEWKSSVDFKETRSHDNSKNPAKRSGRKAGTFSSYASTCEGL